MRTHRRFTILAQIFSAALVIAHGRLATAQVLTQIGGPQFSVDQPNTGATNNQSQPAVAFNGSKFLAVWSDDRTVPAERQTAIYGAFKENNSDPSMQPAMRISTSAGASPSVASDGTNFLAVWNVGTGIGGSIHGAIVSGVDGSSIEFPITAGQSETPSVSWDGRQYVVVWDDFRDAQFDEIVRHIYGANVSGTNVSASFAISQTHKGEHYPKVSSLAGNSLVLWVNDNSDIGAKILRADGSMGPEIALGGSGSPKLAAGAQRYLVVWSQGGGSVFGRWVSSNGDLIDSPFTITAGSGDQTTIASPDVAFGGNSFFVVWQDSRNASGNVFDPNYVTKQVFGVRIGEGGIIDSIPVLVDATRTPPPFPVLSGFSNNYFVLASRAVEKVSHVTANWVSFDAPLFQSITRDESGATLRWISWPGLSYVVESADSPDGQWNILDENVTGLLSPFEVKDARPGTARFYRVHTP
jgi:hypothetical protein